MNGPGLESRTLRRVLTGRFLPVLLSGILLLSMVPSSAFAEEHVTSQEATRTATDSGKDQGTGETVPKSSSGKREVTPSGSSKSETTNGAVQSNASKTRSVSAQSATQDKPSDTANLSAFAAGPQIPKFKVTFKVGSKIYAEEEVLAGSIVTPPADPADPARTNPFHAWYAPNSTNPFDVLEPIEKSITLTAVFSTQHVVTFVDYDGSHLVLKAADNGAVLSTVAPQPPKPPTGETFKYWSDRKGGAEFTGLITSDVTLYPVTTLTTTVIFVTNGPVIPSQTNPNDSFTPTKPDDALMVRAGYEFKHWSRTTDGPAYNFVDELSGVTYLYAVWTPVKVGYVVNFWNEVEDFAGDPGVGQAHKANYELVYTKSILSTDVLAGLAGTKLNTKAQPTAGEADNVINPSLINSRDNYSAGTNILDCSDFYWTDADTKTLSGQGDTVINVYAKRRVYKFKFDMREAHSGGDRDWKFTTEIGSTTWRDYTEFTQAGDGKYYYEVNAKLGQSLVGLWPTEVEPASGSDAHKFKTFNGYYGAGTTTLSLGHIKEMVHNGYLQPDQRELNTEVVMKPDWTTSGVYETRFYYTEVDPSTLTQADMDNAVDSASNVGMAPSTMPAMDSTLIKHTDPTDNDPTTRTRYYRYDSRSSIYTLQSLHVTDSDAHVKDSVERWPGKDIPGYTTITTKTTPKLTERFQTYGRDKYTHNGLDGGIYICYYMPREIYNLTLVTGANSTITGAGTLGFVPTGDNTGYVKPFPYEAAIAPPPENPQRSGYEFEGWYLDDEFTKPYYNALGTPTTEIMPVGGVTLYAKYRGTDITVNYYDGYDDTLLASTTYASNEKLSKSDVARTMLKDVEIGDILPGHGIFRGWFYDVDGNDTLVNAAWGMLLTSGAQPNNIYNLYASFEPTTYTVTFMDTDESGAYTVKHKSLSVPSGKRNTLARQGISESSINDVSKRGYTFMGWNTEEDGSGTYFHTITNVTRDTTVSAQYEIDEYVIDYVLNDNASAPAVNAASNPTTYTVESPDLALAEPTRTGYDFLGWYTDASLENMAATPAIPTSSVGDKTFYAKWGKTSGPTICPPPPVVETSTVIYTEPTGSPSTGDTDYLWFAVMLLVMSGSVVLGKRNRKDRSKK